MTPADRTDARAWLNQALIDLRRKTADRAVITSHPDLRQLDARLNDLYD